MPQKVIDITGQKFNRLTVIERSHFKNKNTYWKCICECGNETIIRGRAIRNGETKSCGCLNKEVVSKNSKTLKLKHGGCVKKNSLYTAWMNIKGRCSNKNKPEYKNYGGRGIRMYSSWKNDFSEFKEWALNNGYEEGLTIDRIDVNGNYEPNNCKWATRTEQANNKRNTVYVMYEGELRSINEVSKLTGLRQQLLQSRKKKGLTDAEIVSKIIKKNQYG
jgi:hypothetical protein